MAVAALVTKLVPPAVIKALMVPEAASAASLVDGSLAESEGTEMAMAAQATTAARTAWKLDFLEVNLPLGGWVLIQMVGITDYECSVFG